jgi:hypothetical protein
MDLDKVIQKAQEEKDKLLQKESKRIAKEGIKKESSFSRWWASLVPYRLFRKFNYRGTAWLFVLSLALAFTCYIIPFSDFSEGSIFPTLLAWTSGILVTLCVTLFLGVEIYTAYRYRMFKNFPSTLDFELKGWEEMIYKKQLLDFEYWWLNCSLEIKLNDTGKNDPKALEALQALCYLNCKQCNRQYYTPFMSETRKPWEATDFRMQGSSNVYVVGVLYEFIYRKLKPFQKKTDLIKTVTIIGDKDFTYVSRETSD